MKFGKRRKDDESPAVAADADVAAAKPAGDPWTAPEAANTVVGRQRPSFESPAADPIVEGSAEELPEGPSSATVVGGIARPVVAEEPVSVVTPGGDPSAATPLGDAAAAHASGHAPAPGPGWPEDVQKLAAERPELVVGAAFVGGLLAAMILRRLGR